MKKFFFYGHFPSGKWRKALLVMKLKLMLILCCAGNMYAATTYSQQAKYDVVFENETIVSVLNELKNLTGYTFVRMAGVIKGDERVTLTMRNATIEQILDKVLDERGYSYQVEDRMVVVTAKTATQQPQGQAMTPLRGTVKDAAGNPIAGVSILIKESTRGTATDKKGNFNIAVARNEVMLFSFLGKKSREITYKGEAWLDIVLEEDATEIENVVVTGIFEKSLASFTGSATIITKEELLQFGNRNLITTIRNIDPSFNIVENNEYGSDPNRLPEVQIRGSSSVPNVNELKDETRVDMNTPLVILDGFESTLQALLNINENEVESIVLLKDASATSIYGSRGANGVVVLNTRSPQSGKLRINYSFDLNIEAPDLSAYNVLNARDKLMLEKTAGLWESTNIDIVEGYHHLLNEVNSGVNTYWLSMPLRVSIGQRHNLRLEGGDNRFRYSASVQYKDTQGVMKKSWKRDFNGTINLTYHYKNIRFTNSFILGIANHSNSPYGTFGDYVRMNPYYRTHDEDGNVNYVYVRYGGSQYNPLYNATLNTYDIGETITFTNNFSVDWVPMEGLSIKGRLGVSKRQGHTDNFKPADHTDFRDYNDEDLFRRGSYIYGTRYGLNFDGSLNVSFSRSFAKKHTVYAGVDVNIRQNEESSYVVRVDGFINEEFDFLSMALQYAQNGKPSGSESLTRAIGFTGNVNYMYDNRFFLDLSGRFDGSSRFGTNRRFAPFWSTGIGWNIHNEQFMRGGHVVSFLKLRASMGITGSQNFNAYQAQSAYRYVTDKRYYNWLGANMIALGNKDLKWQQKMNYNMGVELKMFKNRLSLGCDIYTETTRDLVSSLYIPAANGFISYVENIGKIRNKGIELKASIFLIRDTQHGVAWSISGAMMHNKNELIEISPALLEAQKEIEQASGVDPNFLYKTGYSTKTIWVVPSMGIDPSTGREIYTDRFGNFTYAWDARDQLACGISEPKYQGRISTMFRWRDLSLNLSFGFRFGGQLYNSTLINKVENADYRYNVDARVYNDRWQKPGDVAAFKGVEITTPTQRSSRFVEDEQTLTGQAITMQYRLQDRQWIKRAGLENLHFSASTSDLFYISTVKRERGTSYPFSRQFSFSVSATF